MLEPEDAFVCSICIGFESDVIPDWFVTTPAGHVFHFNKCIKVWLDRGNTRCPFCNENLSLGQLTRLRTIDPNCRQSIPETRGNVDDPVPVLAVENISVSNGNPDFTFKIVLVGDPWVGKSSLIKRYTTGAFHFDLAPTVGLDVSFKTLYVGEKRVKLCLWDTGGQENFKAITQNFVRNSHGVLLVYSYCEATTQSLQHLENWIKFVDDHGIPGAAMMVVGNKMDLRDPQGITTRQGQEFARSRGLAFFETSAKDHYNVDAVFQALVVETVQRAESNQLEYRSTEEEHMRRLRLHEQSQTPSKDSSCCC